MKLKDFPQIANMNKPEQILFVEELWDKISADDSDFPIPESHKKELEHRLEQQIQSPGKLLTINQLQANINSRK